MNRSPINAERKKPKNQEELKEFIEKRMGVSYLKIFYKATASIKVDAKDGYACDILANLARFYKVMYLDKLENQVKTVFIERQDFESAREVNDIGLEIESIKAELKTKIKEDYKKLLKSEKSKSNKSRLSRLRLFKGTFINWFNTFKR